MSHGCCLFCEALLFSRRHDRARFNPAQYLLVPCEELAELRADIGWLLFGHPLRVYARSTQVTPAGTCQPWTRVIQQDRSCLRTVTRQSES